MRDILGVRDADASGLASAALGFVHLVVTGIKKLALGLANRQK